MSVIRTATSRGGGTRPDRRALFLFAGAWLLISAWRNARSTAQPTSNGYPAELAGEGGI